MSRITKEYDSDTLETRLITAGIPCGKLMNVSEVIEDRHVKLRGLVEDISYPDMGKIKIVGTPILFSSGFPEIRLKPPLLGQHTTLILREMGYSEQEISRFLDEGIALQSEQERV